MTDTLPGENWVNITEAASITGYHRDYVRKLVQKFWKLPEAEREIKLLKRTSGYEIWLPDLLEYVKKPARGPQPKRKLPNT